MSPRDIKETIGQPCGVLLAIQLMAGKYKWQIVRALLYQQGPLRFGELRKIIPQTSQKTLTRNLRELEKDDLITRQVYAEVPPRVEYRLTKMGLDMMPVFLALKTWGDTQLLDAPAE